MDFSVKVIKSEKGKDLVLVNSCKYRYIRRRRDGLLRWRCTKRTCYASVLTDCDRTTVVKILGEHSHELDPVWKIERHCLREICKQKPNDGLSYRPIKIIMTELAKTNFNLKQQDLSAICKAMHHKKRNDYWRFIQKLKSKSIPSTPVVSTTGTNFDQDDIIDLVNDDI